MRDVHHRGVEQVRREVAGTPRGAAGDAGRRESDGRGEFVLSMSLKRYPPLTNFVNEFR